MVETVALQIMRENSVLRVPNIMRHANEYVWAELRQRMENMTSREHASTSGTPNKGQAYLAPRSNSNDVAPSGTTSPDFENDTDSDSDTASKASTCISYSRVLQGADAETRCSDEERDLGTETENSSFSLHSQPRSEMDIIEIDESSDGSVEDCMEYPNIKENVNIENWLTNVVADDEDDDEYETASEG